MQQDLAFVLKENVLPSEGGYGWDKGDPGGPTKYGITCFDLAEHRGQKMDSMEHWAPIVKSMTLDEAMDIYNTKYAVKCRFNDMPAGLDYTTIDYGINSGVARPPRVLSALLNLPARSKMDDQLMTTISGLSKEQQIQLIHSINAERLHFMQTIKGGSLWARFGKGWGKRVKHVDDISVRMLSSATATPTIGSSGQGAPGGTITPQGTGKAVHVPSSTVKKSIQHTTLWGTLSSQLGHFWQAHSTTILLTGLGVLVVGVAAYAIYHHWVNWKNLRVQLPPGIVPILSKL